MKRYSLLLESEISDNLKKQLDKIIGILCNNCDGCEEGKECTKQFSANSVGITESDSYADLERIARTYNSATKITFIGVIDQKDDLFYVLKSNGDMEEIRKDIMPKIAKMYEYLTGNGLLLSEIRDLREIMKFSTKTSKTAN